jgi:hypothetical protein
MTVLSFPFWIIFAVVSPVLVLLLIVGVGTFTAPAFKQRPPLIEKYPS